MKRREQLAKLNEMSVVELKEQAESLKESLFRLKFRKTLGAGQTVADIRREKKTLARVETIIKQKESETAKSEA